jgi:hypothetical protein
MSTQSRSSVRADLTQRSAMAFARGARIGVLMISIPSVRKTSSNPAVNFVSRSWMRKRKSLPASANAIERFLACWVTHASLGRAVHGEVKPATRELDRKQDVDRPAPGSVDREEVARQDGRGLGVKELRPAWTRPPRCRFETRAAQDVADRHCRDLVAEFLELALDALVYPSGCPGVDALPGPFLRTNRAIGSFVAVQGLWIEQPACAYPPHRGVRP